MRKLLSNKSEYSQTPLEDPISGVANLFDISIVLIVAMIIALMSALNVLDLLNPEADMTLTKKNKDGQMEIITKKGKEIRVQKIYPEEASGQGERLGTAYQLEDGQVIYVPEK
ncbi:hypothetical protein SMI01S_07320 [Sphingobacterium mizutaii NBRC 14946 = DSM 11724]|uniref:Uncharacterized conserved protein n=2 Tax=Sphingobacterium mizutaii TaxID=1010 RepID=A0AAJ4XAT2_9SPHI|nr:DUF2149 domain-containing protein [Sphingobacterium mizutaii]GEM67126.1 hypothetical protein SMI01S_07320 [Sphingobacterium mizutaii NBRC 14946 = DSM 11724]SDK97412.1 hypothetical protein SAMN05192578_101602 [Sphingobacterium mizutaii]SNV49199.1 Uncharacterized conserved protein [Sphingobacterium mizutaii]